MGIAPRIIPAKAMPPPLSLSGWVLILISATIPNTVATSGVMIMRIAKRLSGEGAERTNKKANAGANNPQTREAIARLS